MNAVFASIIVALTACASAGKGDHGVPVDAPIKQPDARDAAVNECPSTDTCAAAISLGTVSGDTGNMKLTAMGYRAAWFRVRVTEDNNGINGKPLRMSAQVTSPAGEDFDAIVYLNAGSDAVECSTMVGTSSTAGNVKITKAEWGEGSVPNGSNDSRNVSVEIRPAGSACAPAQMWQLEIAGDYP
jgi:hypothetical protein